MPRAIFVVVMILYGAGSLVLGAFLWIVPLASDGLGVATRLDTWPLYLGATSLASAGSVLTALVFWASWRRLEAEPA